VLKVCVTGAAGQIAYSLLYSIANGEVFGKDQVSSASAVGSSVSSFCLAADQSLKFLAPDHLLLGP